MNYSKDWPAGWFVACRSRDLSKRPRSVIIYDTPLVLFRTGTDIAALEDRCPHRNAPLSAGRCRQGTIQCSYHGWRFDVNGHCVAIPGMPIEEAIDTPLRRVSAYTAREIDGLIWVSADLNLAGVPHSNPLVGKRGCYAFIWKTETKGTLADIAENFLDGFHTHFVHAGLIRRDTKRQKVSAQVRREGNLVEVRYIGEGKQGGLISRLLERNRTESFGRFILPGIAELEYRSPTRTEIAISVYMTPSEGDCIQIFAVIAVPGGLFIGRFKQIVLSPFLYLALLQDKRIITMQSVTIRRFNGPHFVSTHLDLIRPHIERLLRHGPQDGLIIGDEIVVEL